MMSSCLPRESFVHRQAFEVSWKLLEIASQDRQKMSFILKPADTLLVQHRVGELLTKVPCQNGEEKRYRIRERNMLGSSFFLQLQFFWQCSSGDGCRCGSVFLLLLFKGTGITEASKKFLPTLHEVVTTFFCFECHFPLSFRSRFNLVDDE